MSRSAFVAIAPRTASVAEAVTAILHALGEDPAREGLRRTPQRVARSLAHLTSGLGQTGAGILRGAVVDGDSEQMVLVRGVDFYSLCEHHLLPFHGQAHVAYLPARRIVSPGKLARVVEVCARRLQIQERLTREVAEAVWDALRPRGVAVMVEAAHLCMMMRGVAKQHSRTVTSALLGEFRESFGLRREFLAATRGRGE